MFKKIPDNRRIPKRRKIRSEFPDEEIVGKPSPEPMTPRILGPFSPTKLEKKQEW